MQENNAKGAQKASLPFYIQEDGHGTKHKIIDLTDENICPREGVIIFHALDRKNKSRVTDMPFKACKDKESGVWIGIYTGVDERKNLMWLPIYLGISTIFNREDKNDAEKVACLLRSNIVEGSPNLSQNIKIPFFRVHDEVKAATLTIKRIQDGQKAVSLAASLFGEDLENQARNMGINTSHSNHAIMLAEVMTRAEKSPAEFLKIWENPHRNYITTFYRGIETGIITHDPISGYYFKGIPLGVNEAFVVDYFNKYKDIASTIDALSKERLSQSSTKTTKVIVEDPEKAALLRRIAELEASKEEPNLVKELEEEKEKAKKLKIQGAHLHKPNRESIDALKQKIKDAEEVPE